ncbi:MAG: NADH-quinone oxidoreductase subunit NuoK [Thermaerobacter sp.]|jgi:NADH-quinone oxidoreductase subunit K|nr:NADH-quinone oxidoreductase subunit NuoK [Thermaerobacter sp.]MDA8147079.1 NADH-quinone oxidoreductase subunit NuoK [Thermaerobacter sp.]
MNTNLTYYLVLGICLFAVGTAGVLVRKNPLVMFMSVELMWNAVNLIFLAFSRYLADAAGQVFVFLVITVAAAEVATGLGIIVVVFRRRRSLDADRLSALKE